MVLVQHHIKYLEIHGVDEIVWMEASEHKKLHKRLRADGKCEVPPAVLKKISVAARGRSEKGRNIALEKKYPGKKAEIDTTYFRMS